MTGFRHLEKMLVSLIVCLLFCCFVHSEDDLLSKSEKSSVDKQTKEPLLIPFRPQNADSLHPFQHEDNFSDEDEDPPPALDTISSILKLLPSSSDLLSSSLNLSGSSNEPGEGTSSTSESQRPSILWNIIVQKYRFKRFIASLIWQVLVSNYHFKTALLTDLWNLFKRVSNSTINTVVDTKAQIFSRFLMTLFRTDMNQNYDGPFVLVPYADDVRRKSVRTAIRSSENTSALSLTGHEGNRGIDINTTNTQNNNNNEIKSFSQNSTVLTKHFTSSNMSTQKLFGTNQSDYKFTLPLSNEKSKFHSQNSYFPSSTARPYDYYQGNLQNSPQIYDTTIQNKYFTTGQASNVLPINNQEETFQLFNNKPSSPIYSGSSEMQHFSTETPSLSVSQFYKSKAAVPVRRPQFNSQPVNRPSYQLNEFHSSKSDLQRSSFGKSTALDHQEPSYFSIHPEMDSFFVNSKTGSVSHLNHVPSLKYPTEKPSVVPSSYYTFSNDANHASSTLDEIPLMSSWISPVSIGSTEYIPSYSHLTNSIPTTSRLTQTNPTFHHIRKKQNLS